MKYKPKKYEIEIIFEDDDVIVIEKPAGLLSVPTDKELSLNAFSLLKEKIKTESLFVVHRLDRETSGVMFFVKSKETQDFYTKDWTEKVKSRTYIAVIEGTLEPQKGSLEHWLKQNKGFVVYSAKEGEIGAQKAITHYDTIKIGARPSPITKKKRSLIECELETGLTNQIRVQCAEIGCPVVSDPKYGQEMEGVKLALHARRLAFVHPKSGEVLTFESPIPGFFKQLL